MPAPLSTTNLRRPGLALAAAPRCHVTPCQNSKGVNGADIAQWRMFRSFLLTPNPMFVKLKRNCKEGKMNHDLRPKRHPKSCNKFIFVALSFISLSLMCACPAISGTLSSAMDSACRSAFPSDGQYLACETVVLAAMAQGTGSISHFSTWGSQMQGVCADKANIYIGASNVPKMKTVCQTLF